MFVGSFVGWFVNFVAISRKVKFVLKFGTGVKRLYQMSLLIWEVKVNVQGHLFRERPTQHGDDKT